MISSFLKMLLNWPGRVFLLIAILGFVLGTSIMLVGIFIKFF